MTEMLDDLFDLGDDDITTVNRRQTVKAPFGWVGGKSESLKHMLPIFGRLLKDKWVDVFGGSGIVSWNMPNVRLMVYNDAYSGVYDFYRCLQDERLCDRLIYYIGQLMPPHSREQWYAARDEWCTDKDVVVRAAKWFYMIKGSVISKGKCYGRSTNSKAQISIPNALADFSIIHEKLHSFQLENLDFRTCLKDYDSRNALIYCDPPYIHTDTGIYDVKFSMSDYKDLLRLIGQCSGTVCLSGYPNELADNQSYWTSRETWDVSIRAEAHAYSEQNNKADKRDVQTVGVAREVLWIKESK